MNIDLAIVARDLKLPPEKLELTVQLLDEGNTIPFITRFRKDQTGGLDENQVLAVKQKVAHLRALAERKTFVLKSIDSQGKLTDELKAQINKASSSAAIEDLYRPFKARKQSRANTARQQGLEPLAEDIFSGASADQDLSELATRYVRVDKGLASVDDVFKGVSDLLVEKFSEHRELRSELRRIVWTTGKLTSKAIESTEPAAEKPATEIATAENPAAEETAPETQASVATPEPAAVPPSDEASTAKPESVEESPKPSPVEAASPEPATTSEAVAEPIATTPEAADASAGDAKSKEPTVESVSAQFASAISAIQPAAIVKKKKKKKKKKKVVNDPFKDYHDFSQPLRKLPQYRVLAINRGERAGALKVKVDADDEQLTTATVAQLVPAEHPFQEFLKKSAVESLNRVMFPSLEREVRRELTEAAEKHAVDVFANNLRSLLLQPPIRDCRVLAIDPGFKRGCSVAILDAGGNMLESGHVFVVGNKGRIEESGKKIADWLKQYQTEVIAIGNGTACRHVEQMVSDVIGSQTDQKNVRYVIVNEAGASIYSTSEIGREELPDVSPSIRSAVSIGRRLQDPLSELVKISPANIGVGMYQHDVKAKHLSDSLDDVVRFCTNRIGVNVNSASPSLLKYVSGLNALTARRIFEHRKEHGSFKSRSQLQDVSGFGEATFLQAAGFLRIHDGESPLDSTAIHPESYPIAEGIIQKAAVDLNVLFPKKTVPSTEPVVAAAAESSSVAPPADAVAASDAETTGDEAVKQDGVADAVPPAASESPEAPADSAPIAVDEVAAPQPVLASADKEARQAAIGRLNELKIEELASEFSSGGMLVKDILLALKKPDWDPRDRASRPIFRRGIVKPDDLKPEMQLDAQVVNVVDFGVFVDIGLGESCLVHVSELSHSYIRDPHDHYSIGQVLKVWVSEIDSERRRVKLTAIRPGAKKPARGGGRSRSGQGSSPSHAKRAGSSEGAGRGNRGGGRSGSSDNRGRTERGARGGKSSPRMERARRKPARPKPVKPITDQMLKGEEPMRSFSDLMQFVTKKPGDDKKDDNKKSKE